MNKKVQTALTIGNFDGLHLGHKKLINRLKYIARVNNLEPLVYVIEKPFLGDKILKLEQKINILNSMGIDNVCFENFTKRFKFMMADNFIKDILKDRFNAKIIVLGEDFRFGKDRLGDISYLKNFFSVDVVKKIDGVSSTNIRDLIGRGDIRKANKLLGREFSLIGEVIEGLKIGRTIGFRTANIKVNQILPSNGVYKTKTLYNGKICDSITNVGYNPTVGGLKYKSVETHIFDFDEDIYGKNIEVYFLNKIRDERRFDSVNELINQIKIDIKRVRKV